MGNTIVTKDQALRRVFVLLTDLRTVFSSKKGLENRVSRELDWEKPRIGWMKLNVDGIVKKDPSRATYGRLIRGTDGEWISAFAAKLGDAPITLTELTAIQEDLKLALQLQCEKLMVESDSKVPVELIQHSDVFFCTGMDKLYLIAATSDNRFLTQD